MTQTEPEDCNLSWLHGAPGAVASTVGGLVGSATSRHYHTYEDDRGER